MNSYIGNPVNLAVESTVFSHSVPPMNFYQRLENVIQSTSENLRAYFNFPIQNKYIEKYFGPGYPDALELQKDLSLVFLNYHHAISDVRSLTPSVIPIAGIHIQDHDDPLPKANN